MYIRKMNVFLEAPSGDEQEGRGGRKEGRGEGKDMTLGGFRKGADSGSKGMAKVPSPDTIAALHRSDYSLQAAGRFLS